VTIEGKATGELDIFISQTFFMSWARGASCGRAELPSSK